MTLPLLSLDLAPPPHASRFWRGRFVELAEQLYRELGHPLPSVAQDPDVPIGVELEIDGLLCEVSHLPLERPDQLAIACSLPLEPERIRLDVLASLLRANQELLQIGGSLSVDPDSGDLVYAVRRAIEGLQALDLLVLAADMAARARAWQHAGTGGAAPAWCEIADTAAPAGGAHGVRALIDEVCRQCGSTEPADAGAVATCLTVNGADFTLRPCELGDSQRLHLECRFGALPIDGEPAQSAALRLLHLNRALLEFDSCAAFALDEGSGEATFWQSFELPGTHPANVVDAIHRLAAQSAAWRTDHYLNNTPVPPEIDRFSAALTFC